MPEAVIVDAVRTPDRPRLQGLARPAAARRDGAFIVDSLLERNPDVDPALIEDVFCGLRHAAGPAGLQRRPDHRPALREAVRRRVNGVTISRYCASIARRDPPRRQRDQGRRGRRLRRRRGRVREPLQRAHRARRRRRPQPEPDRRERPARTPTSRWASPRSTSPRSTRSAAPTWTSTRSARRSSRSPRRRTASSTARSSRSPTTTATRSPRTTARGPPRRSRSSPSCDEAFEGGGGVTAGNSCPLNDGAAAVLVMSDTKAEELGLTPRARIVSAATWGNEPEYMGVAPIGAIKKVLERDRDDDRRRRRGRAQRGLRRPGDPDHGRVRDPAREAQHPRRRDRPRATPSG